MCEASPAGHVQGSCRKNACVQKNTGIFAAAAGRSPEREGLSLVHGPQEIHHLDGALGALGALVAGLAAGTLDGLFNGVRGEDAEQHRHAALQRRMGHALGHLGAHIVVVGGGTTDDSAQADYRVILVALGQVEGGYRNLKGTGYQATSMFSVGMP